jgi:hypothetical protein
MIEPFYRLAKKELFDIITTNSSQINRGNLVRFSELAGDS